MKRSEYEGHLVKVGGFVVPNSMMMAETYSDILNAQDLDSYRDANGILHRDVLEHVVPKIEFNIPPMKTDDEITDFFWNISNQYINKKEKSANVTSYVSEWGRYETMKMYLSPSIQFPIRSAGPDKIIYNAIRVAFIAY